MTESVVEPNSQKAEKLTVFQTGLALVATTVGGGLLGMPFAFYRFGIINSVFLCIVLAVLGQVSVMLYLRAKDLTPRKYESIYEIAYLLNGKVGIFVVIIVQFMSAFFAMIMYYMILGDTVGHLFG